MNIYCQRMKNIKAMTGKLLNVQLDPHMRRPEVV